MSKKIPGEPTFDEPVERMETVEPFAPVAFAVAANADVVAPDVSDTSGLLSVAEIAEIEAEVKAAVLKDRKKAARKVLMEKLLVANRAETESNQEKVEITISTPDFAAIDLASSGIRINGVPYIQGRSYIVPRATAEVLRETMQRAWHHEEITKGHKDPNAYRRQRNENQNGVPVSTSLMRF